jgi:hypothetical protein
MVLQQLLHFNSKARGNPFGIGFGTLSRAPQPGSSGQVSVQAFARQGTVSQ